MEHHIDKFRNMLLIKRLQPNTIETYTGCLRQFLYWCADGQVLPEEVSDEALVEYLAGTKSESLLRQRIGTIQNFYQHCLGIPYKIEPQKRIA